VFLDTLCNYILRVVCDTARDTYLVSTLSDMQSKLDCVMRIVSRMSADSVPAN